MEISKGSATRTWRADAGNYEYITLSTPLTTANVKVLKLLTLKASGTVNFLALTIMDQNFETIATAGFNNTDTANITYESGKDINSFMGTNEIVLRITGSYAGDSAFTGTVTVEFGYYNYNFTTWTGTASVSSGATNVTVTSNSYFPSEWIEYIDKFRIDIGSSPSSLIGFFVYEGNEELGSGMFTPNGPSYAGTSITTSDSHSFKARRYLHDTNQIRIVAGSGSFPAGTMTVTVDYKKSNQNHARTFNENGKQEWNTVWYYNGSTFVRCDPKYYDGTTWRNCI